MNSEPTLQWDKPAPSESGEASTWGYLRITHGARVLWGAAPDSGAPGIYWTWIDLLEHLAQHWPWLVGENGWPPNLMLSDLRPAEFDHTRGKLLENAAPSARLQIDSSLFRFREDHDLSLGLRGKVVPRFWVVRQGADAWLGGNSAVRTSWKDAEQLLVSIGDRIAARLAGLSDERSQLALQVWKAREQADSMLRAEAALGVDSDTVRRLFGDVDPANQLELPSTGFESSELAFAARLAAPSLAPDTVNRLLGCIRKAPPQATAGELLSFAAAAESIVDRDDYAHDQGVRLGGWLRGMLGMDQGKRAEPEALLAEWGIVCSTVSLNDPAVDAVACWGKLHGPAVYVNDDGKRAQGVAGRRATIAHEIAHLLLDRQRALPLSEVQGAIFRGRLEQRANAFAAEFLIPQAVAGPAFATCKHRSDAEKVLQQLQSQFIASPELIAWQAINFRQDLPLEARRLLAEQVPPDRRARFFAY